MSKKETNESGVKTSKTPKNFKKLKFGSMSLIVMVLVIAIVVVINLMCGILSDRYPLKLDLTPDKRYELSEDSINAVKNLDKDIEITVTCTKDTFASMGNYFKQMYANYYGVNVDMPYEMIPEILDKYSMYAENSKGKITVKYVDINKDPDIVTRYSKYYNGEISEGNIVVFSGERIKVIGNDEVVSMISPSQTSTQNNITMAFVGESTLTSAIMSVTDANPVSVGFITSMNKNAIYESSYAGVVKSFEELLSKNGYDCTEIDTSDDMSPDDYDMIVLPVPNVDFSSDIIDKMGDFLYNDGNYGKNMIYIPHLNSANLTNIDEFLADWKIQVESSIILDENMIQAPIQSLGVVDAAVMLNIADNDSVGTLANTSLPIAAPYNRNITVLSKNSESVATVVLKSTDTAYLQEMTKDGDKSEKGEYNAAVISKKETSSGMATLRSNMLVLGSSFMVDNGLISNTSTYNNSAVILGMVNTMTGKEGGVTISEKALQQATIAPTTGEINVIKIVVIYVIPFIVAAAGIIVLLRRRNK
ncbi:MAG: GldG family protein [Ruminococcus sp.]|nr:GldG family protein [Ruminococcus sp.]